ncbi:hypothetical protein KC614_04775 [candidate division WWE3 bacterium]|uniref:Uncharacterized protein n=1 Tax=candidate division WWE3 bacterium TaxID=2053526 RepID=A0A955LLA0_UNCKA|nr:hypothetical protein [candidate division WWE3 bacterium]
MRIAIFGGKSQQDIDKLRSAFGKEGYDVYLPELASDMSAAVDEFKSVRDGVIGSDMIVCGENVVNENMRYHLALALEYRRPTVIIVEEGSKVTETIKSIKNRNLTVLEYKTDKDVEAELLAMAGKIKDSLDAKLFMNIPPSMNKYLDWVATHTRFSKSDVVREAVEKTAQGDTAYQAFLDRLEK